MLRILASLIIVAGFAGASVGGLGAAVTAAQPSSITIISSLPRTGSSKGQTDSIVNGIKMALEDANYQAAGMAINYEDMDDATAASGTWDAAQEAANANQAINDPSVMGYIGTYNSGAAAISIPLLCQADLAMISPAATSPGLTKPGKGDTGEPDKYYPGCPRNFARVVPADDIQGAVGAHWAQQLGVHNVYVLDDQDLYGENIAKVFAQTASQIGLDVVGGPDGIDPQAPDYRALAFKIANTNPDLVYFGGITQHNAGKLWQDITSTIPGVKMMGPDGIYEQAFLDAAGPAAEGSYITFGGVPPSKLSGKGAAWYTRYKSEFGTEPEAYAAYGYESASVLIAAINTAGIADRATIRDAMMGTKNFDGVLGTWSFDQNGDTSLTAMSGRQVVNGQFDDADAVILQAS